MGFFGFFCLSPNPNTLKRAFLHTLQGVQNNTPFLLLHSLQIHTLEGVQNYTPFLEILVCSAWPQITDLIEIKINKRSNKSVQFTNLIIAKVVRYLQYI